MTNEQIIWDYFIAEDKIGNPYGVAGLMGNIKAESSYKPQNLSNTANKKLGLTDEEYTAKVDDGSYDNFIKDGYDYGLCQWVFWSRKKKLYEFAKNKGVSIGDLQMQIEFIWQELQAYSSVLKILQNTNNLEEATNYVLTKYEKPADQGEKTKEKRLGFAADIYNRLFVSPSIARNNEEDKGVHIPKKVRVTGKQVNVRYGDATEYSSVGVVRKGSEYEVAAISADTGWFAIRVPMYKTPLILWISPKYVEPIYEEEFVEEK